MTQVFNEGLEREYAWGHGGDPGRLVCAFDSWCRGSLWRHWWALQAVATSDINPGLGGSGGSGNAAACMPWCETDSDCGGRTCGITTGLCTDTPVGGDPVGSSCPSGFYQGNCAGFCVGTNNATGRMCTALCNVAYLGQPGACGSDPQAGSPQDAACLYEIVVQGLHIGVCAQLCDCDSDCRAAGMVCQSWANSGIQNPGQAPNLFHKQGLCAAATGTDGGVVDGIPTCP